MGKLYSCVAVEKLIERYTNKGGEVTEIEEGVLGYGLLMLHGEGLKTTIVKEVPLNCWSSAHTIRTYNKCPKKYAEMLERKEREYDETSYTEHN